MAIPRILLSALRGGSGKTVLSVGIIAALKQAGLDVTPFKKGPDYIDAGWLSLAAQSPCYNLDTYLADDPAMRDSFLSRSRPGSISVIEGNRGLFDSIDSSGSTSTAELAKLLTCPVLLILDCTKTTRTLAAMVMGCSHFDPRVDVRGVILNRIAGPRHQANITKNIEKFAGIPVVGAVPKLSSEDFPERHMGLVPTPEHDWAAESIDRAATVANEYLDMEAIIRIAQTPMLPLERRDMPASDPLPPGNERPRIGVVRDSAFQFYYPENLEALEAAGAQVVPFSLLSGRDLPEMDGLYIGGGFPETHAIRLSENTVARESLRKKASEGMPIYAECGGLMYLCRTLVLGENHYPMAGILPAEVGVQARPAGHGYTRAKVTGENPFYPKGTLLRGHEFHYSKILSWDGEADLAFTMERGKGIMEKRDGACFQNVLATYSHVHALGTPGWAPALVEKARQHKNR